MNSIQLLHLLFSDSLRLHYHCLGLSLKKGTLLHSVGSYHTGFTPSSRSAIPWSPHSIPHQSTPPSSLLGTQPYPTVSFHIGFTPICGSSTPGSPHGHTNWAPMGYSTVISVRGYAYPAGKYTQMVYDVYTIFHPNRSSCSHVGRQTVPALCAFFSCTSCKEC